MVNHGKIISFIFITAALFSCAEYGQKKNGPPPDTFRHDPPSKTPNEFDVAKQEIDSMHRAYILDSTVRAITENISDSPKIASKSPVVNPKINGSVFYSLPYCGGIMPSQETLDALAKLKPLPNSTLILQNISGEKFQIGTDGNGKFSASIPEGDYDVYLTEDVGGVWNVSPENCKDCLKDPITKIKLTLKGKNKIEFKFRCGPIPRP